MSDKNKALVEELESIIRLMADIWPTDRDNIPEAGARFEKVIADFDQNFGQLQKLINLSWDGLKHLYEKDDYFMMVKSASMQAVNTIREYILQDGNIKVEEFEKAYEDLEKSLKGGSESADTVIELEEQEAEKGEKSNQENKPNADKPSGEELLSELAAFIMTLSEASATEKKKKDLEKILEYVIDAQSEEVCAPLNEALSIVKKAIEGSEDEGGWLREVSEKTEQAIEIQSDEDWDGSVEGEVSKEIVSDDDTDEAVSSSDGKNKVFIIPEDIEIAMVGEFVTECSDLIQMAESALLELEESPGDDELINTIFRSFHTIKGTSAFMGLDPVSEFTHWVETFLSMVREGDLEFDQACADISLESIDIINKMLAVVEHAKGGDPLPTPLRFDGMMTALHEVTEESVSPEKAYTKARLVFDALEEKIAIEAEEVEAENSDSGKAEELEANTSKSESESSVRVSVNRLDRLIDMVGELVIAHSVVAQDSNISKDSDLEKKVNHATKILRELQDTSLTLRMVPMKATFHKMNRLVRDLSRKAAKQVKFETEGEDTEIDRNMVDVISEPLIHMIRNSLDHGVETPDERAKTGKEETARILLSASQEGGKVVIKIQDDGRGINKDKILAKAVEKGLVDPDKKMTEKEIFNLIFLPGFSSAEKVTDLSGRGVGMDVVRRSIEQLQGKVDVTSVLGKGTTITIELPFTLAITDGMVVRIGEQRFIVPTINIDMTFRAENKDVFTVLGDSEQVSFRGKSVPVVRLHRLFEIHGAVESLLEGTLLVIKNNNKRYALLVDEVIGQQQLVGKSINMMAKMDHISGGAIMGDGQVGLILDTVALVA
ncbi:MAG: chemotaxis protein CheA [Gracilimonas sp.]